MRAGFPSLSLLSVVYPVSPVGCTQPFAVVQASVYSLVQVEVHVVASPGFALKSPATMRCVACGESHDCSHRIWFARTAGAAQNKWVVEMSTGMPLTVTCRRIASNGCDGSLSMSVCDSPSTGSHVR